MILVIVNIIIHLAFIYACCRFTATKKGAIGWFAAYFAYIVASSWILFEAQPNAVMPFFLTFS